MKAAFAPAILLAVMLAGCNSSAPPPVASAPSGPVAHASLELPSGSGCAAEVSRWNAIAESDRDTGNVNQSVYNEIAREISGAAAACRAGRDGEARALVSASKRRHGYPG